MTERIYYHDSYQTDIDAQVAAISEDNLRICLDQTVFYPTSGGQPHDLGILNGVRVVRVEEQDDRIWHELEAPQPEWQAGMRVQGQVDWVRRRDHMQQHTAQHLLSAVLAEEFGVATVSFHMGADYSTIDLEPLDKAQRVLEEATARANERIREGLGVSVSFENSRTAQGLRKPPAMEGTIRVVTIAGLDRSACGGTHVRTTGEIGSLLLGRTEKVRASLRVEFFAAARVEQEVKRRLEEAAAQEKALRARVEEAEKLNKKLQVELAERRGRERYAAGQRAWVEEVAELSESVRTEATAFVEGGGACAILYSLAKPSLLFAAEASLGVDCGKVLKEQLATRAGKGGGSARMAQGSLGGQPELLEVVAALRAATTRN